MERRTFKFFTKRPDNCNNAQKQEDKITTLQVKSLNSNQPLKDNTNIQSIKVFGVIGAETQAGTNQNKSSNNSMTGCNTATGSKIIVGNISDHRQNPCTSATVTTERPLKCLETLAQKAGITFDEKYEVASTLLTLEKSQSPAQVAAPSAVPLQISPEQLQQLQQIQLQQAQFTAIQVKQEFPSQNQIGNTNSMTAELKHQMVEHNQSQVQQMQVIEGPPASPHQTPNSTAMANPQHSAATINTMSPLQTLPAGQVPADWGHGRLQLLQPSISNQGYLQHLYPQVLMSGNLLHSGLGQQPIQVIAAGKPFQSSQITPQMLTATAQNKPMISGTTGSFSGAYTLPTIPSSQSQTLLFSPVSVISSQPQQQQQQQNIIPTMQTTSNKSQIQDNQKSIQGQKVLQKVASTTSVANAQSIAAANAASPQSSQQCVQVSQTMPTAQIISPLQQAGSQHMQIAAPWVQSVPQFWANGIQSQALLAPNPIIIRGTQPDGTQGMFIPQTATHQAIQTQQTNQTLTLPCNVPQATTSKPRPQIEALAPKQQPRAPPILPQNGPPLRPASSVSTQTAQNQNLLNQKQNKLRNKQQAVRPALPGVKSDASNQTKATTIPQIQQQQTMHQVVTSAGNKMVVMSTGTPITIQSSQTVQNQNDKQQMQMQQIKQQQALMQQQILMQQSSNPQLIHQQIAQQIQLQHPQTQQSQVHHQSNLQQGQQNNYITQQQQQQQIQNQLMQQQQQHQQQQQQQAQSHQQIQQQIQHQHQQREQTQQTGIIHHIVVQQQQQLPQVSTVPISTGSSSNIHHINLQAKQQVNLSQSLDRQTSVSVASNHATPSVQQAAPMISQASSQISSVNSIQPAITVTMTPASTQSTLQQPAANSLISMTSVTSSSISNTPTASISTICAKTAETKLLETSQQSITLPMEVDTQSVVIIKESAANNIQSMTVDISNETVDTSNIEKKGVTEEILLSSVLSNEQSSAALLVDESTLTIGSVNEKQSENRNKVTSVEEISAKSTTANTTKSVTSVTSAKAEKDLPKAMIKPNVLTHVIEGFVIQEANEPFAVTRQRYSEKEEEPPKKRLALDETASTSGTTGDTVPCENCGKHESKSKLKKKRFCSLSCARAPKSSVENGNDGPISADDSGKDVELMETAQQTNDKLHDQTTLKTSNGNCVDELPMMVHWTVSDVCEFIKNLPGCSDYADDFAMQEIDGQALLLLKENHLVNAMGMKLGPALKIVAKVESMKENSGIEKETQ